MDKQVELKLSMKDVDKVLMSLGKMPAEFSMKLILDIQRQCQAQLEDNKK